MKNSVILIIIFLLFNTAIAFSEESTSEQKPVGFLPESTFEFEPVIEGDKTYHDFFLKNNGTSPLKIIKLEAG